MLQYQIHGIALDALLQYNNLLCFNAYIPASSLTLCCHQPCSLGLYNYKEFLKNHIQISTNPYLIYVIDHTALMLP